MLRGCKKSNNKQFDSYGGPFGKADVIGEWFLYLAEWNVLHRRDLSRPGQDGDMVLKEWDRPGQSIQHKVCIHAAEWR